MEAASLLGGAAVGAVFGELLKAVLEIKNKATMFKQTLNDLRSTLLAVYPVVTEIEHRNNDLGRPKEELESLIRKMEEGIQLVYRCSKIGRYNYAAKVRYQEQLMALADSLLKFFIIDMQAQTARDQKETLYTVRRILSTVNKLPLESREDTMASSSDSAPMPGDVSESETHYSSATETFSVEEAMELVDQVYGSESGSTAIQQAEDAAAANTTGKVMEAGHRYHMWYSRFHWKGRRKRGGGLYENIKKNWKFSSRHFKEQGKNATRLDNSEEVMEVHYFKLSTIKDATNYFCHEAKVGEGGFGTIYKGRLVNGKEIAVKRIKTNSTQGLEEFKNEMIIGKLQHKNIIRLLGYSLDENERILVYEYMYNNSLAAFLFDPTKRIKLDWPKRVKIINEIAKDLVYLHEYSRLKIIHRDIKPSNVLLDEEMNPKIADFGIAMIFCANQFEEMTDRVAGTIGYMAPETMGGLFSIKSDVYSFGILMLEIISGRKNIGFHPPMRGCTSEERFQSDAWQLWSEGKGLEFMDPLMVNSCTANEALRLIHIGLLCVQERPKDRPTISSVILMLGSTIDLPLPSAPQFSVCRYFASEQSSTTAKDIGSLPFFSGDFVKEVPLYRNTSAIY